MRKIFVGLLTIVAILLVIVLVRTCMVKSRQQHVTSSFSLSVPDSAVTHLQQAIQYKTISFDTTPTDSAAFNGFHHFLQRAFPLIHRKLSMETISNYSLLFKWKGKDPSAKPIIFVAHQDVVPAEEASRRLWKADPFGGEIKEDYVWGRGTVDDKGGLMALLEGIERLLQEGFVPQCDVYVSLGHDEEATGKLGAKMIVSLLKQRNIQPAFVLDEGGEITNHEIPGLRKPVALIGIAEKGYVTVDVVINIPGGHSSMPAKETAIDQLASAIVKLKTHPFPATFNYTVNAFMDYVAPEMPFTQRMVLANGWLFNPLIKKLYSGSPGSDAMMRTTTAPTLFNSGIKENVIPSVASATINFRTLPGTTPDDVLIHVKDVINDKRINIILRPGASSPNAVADVNHPSFTYLQQAILNWRNDLIVTPYLVLGATDGRYFTALTPQVYRFTPFNDMKGFHGVDERIGIDEYKKGIGFYYGLIKNYKLPG